MMNIFELNDKKLDKKQYDLYIKKLATLHKRAFPDFFLTQLGQGFLSTLYRGYLEDAQSGIIVAEKEDGRLMGFIAYSKDYSSFFKGLVKKHIMKFGICAAGASLRHPSFAGRLLRAFGKSDEVSRTEKYVELSSIAVHPSLEGKGVGSKLIDYLKAHTDFSESEYISLETDADNNEYANAFYQKNGFRLERVYFTREKRRMNEYRFAPEIKAPETKKPEVLLIATAFFGYEQKMKAMLERLGYRVTFFDERSVKSAMDRALIKVSTKLFEGRTRRYYRNIVDSCKGHHFKMVVVYGATMMDDSILKILKKGIDAESYRLCLGDSVRDNGRYESIFKYFDKVFTFDRVDYEYFKKNHSHIELLPFFYSDEYFGYGEKQEKYKYDISFVGTVHSDRLRLMKAVKAQAEQMGLKCFYFCYLQSRFIYYYYLLKDKEFRGTKPSDFSYDKLSADKIREIMKQSRAVLDIQYPKNSGLTMRTLETLGIQRKIITTNADIKNYDFYNENNVLVIDRDDPQLKHELFETEFEPTPREIYDKYSLESWMRTVTQDLETGKTDGGCDR